MKKKAKTVQKSKKTGKMVCECNKCGYKHVHLHKGKCPMCVKCPRCSEKLHSCKCIEGE